MHELSNLLNFTFKVKLRNGPVSVTFTWPFTSLNIKAHQNLCKCVHQSSFRCGEWLSTNHLLVFRCGEWLSTNHLLVFRCGEWLSTNHLSVLRWGEWLSTNHLLVFRCGEWLSTNHLSVFRCGEWLSTNHLSMLRCGEWLSTNVLLRKTIWREHLKRVFGETIGEDHCWRRFKRPLTI